MAGYARVPGLPRPLTQMFNDNKKLYEELMQGRGSSPDLSPLYLKLRIQKDRLIAWGIQWADRSKSDDMDGPLGRAGINDLVASIMDSIKALLEEAEGLSPSSVGGAGPSAGEKGKMRMPQHSPDSIRRLEEINRDLTMSIDTLCDLSRTRLEPPTPEPKPRPQPREQRSMKQDVKSYVDEKARLIAAESLAEVSQLPRYEEPQRNVPMNSALTDDAFIEPDQFSEVAPMRPSHSSPPSYESILTGSEDRVVAQYTGYKPILGQSSSGASPVLLDYKRVEGVSGGSDIRPNSGRFEKLALAMSDQSVARNDDYLGFLKLAGWTFDLAKSRYAFVYNLPTSDDAAGPGQPNVDLQPRSLLTFLQNGGDADSSNLPPLEHRLRLASNVALSVGRLLELGVVHGNLNSTNVVFFLDRQLALSQDRIWKSTLIRKPYVTGLHHLGYLADAKERDSLPASLYLPPSDETGPTNPFDAMHDIYSLGLILLEIGLWMPIGKFMKSKYSRRDFKLRLQSIYLKKLAAKCGSSYMQAVHFCMAAADHPRQSPEAFANLMSRFNEKVVGVLQRCCLLDGDQTPVPVSKNTSSGKTTEQTVFDSNTKDRPAKTSGGAMSAGPMVSPASAKAVFAGEPKTLSASQQTKQVAAAAAAQQQEAEAPPSGKSCITVWSHDIPSLYQQYWQSTMYPRLEKILRRAISRWESYSIDLFMAGEDSDTARPTLYMECTSTKKVRRILQHLNKELRLFDIKVVPGQIMRSKAKKRKSAKKAKYLEEEQVDDLNPHFQQKPLSGASIGAFLKEQHLPPVSFGGTVLVAGEPFGMSVHHMLEDEDEMDLGLENVIKLQRSMAHSDTGSALHRQESTFSVDASSIADDDDVRSVTSARSDTSSHFDENGPENLYPFEIEDPVLYDDELDIDDHDDDFWLEPDFDADAIPDEPVDEGDTIGIRQGHGDDLFVTQPALDDVGKGFFPSEEDKDFEHLCSHTFGHVYASSGLRRAMQDDLIHEIDWALIRVNETRQTDPGKVVPPTPGQKAGTPEAAALQDRPRNLMPSTILPNRAVHCYGRTSGYATGTILPAMRLVRMPGRVSPSHSWQVRGNFGSGGDSGAWVIDTETGGVCGHVLAYSESSGVAYIAPMDVMIDDMSRTLGKPVCLPGQTSNNTSYQNAKVLGGTTADSAAYAAAATAAAAAVSGPASRSLASPGMRQQPEGMAANARQQQRQQQQQQQQQQWAGSQQQPPSKPYTAYVTTVDVDPGCEMRGVVHSMRLDGRGAHLNRMSNSHIQAQC